MSVDVNNESGRTVDERALVDVSRHVLDRLRIHPLAELSIVLVDAPAMAQLHVQWMDEEGPTDVLSFPMDELRPSRGDAIPTPGLLGDVVLCPDVAEQQAVAAGHSTDDELALLCTHGILHLVGYDHAEPEEERAMFALQGELLGSWRGAGGGIGPVSADHLWLLFIAVALVVLAGALAMLEAALSRVSRVGAEVLVREGRRGARALRAVVDDPAGYLNVLALLRVVSETAGAVLVAVVCVEVVDNTWQVVGLAAGSMALASYIVIGVSPRTLGQQHANAVGLAGAGLLRGITRVLGPLPRLLILLGNAVTPGKGFREGPFASEAELRDFVDQAQERRLIEDDERAMIHSVFELGDTIVREVMVPRTDMVYVERGKSLRQALSLALRSGFSRIPVIGDGVDDVVGVVYLKDLARRTFDYNDSQAVEKVMRPAPFVPDSKPVADLLREMQAAQNHMAIVIDEYGGTAGLVTIEDILEEIVGEITDEYDRESPQVEQVSDGVLRVSSRLHIDDLGELFGVELDDDDVDTVGGLLAKHLGKVPIPGSTVDVEGLVLTAESTQGRRNRVGTVLVERVNSPGAEDADQDDRIDA